MWCGRSTRRATRWPAAGAERGARRSRARPRRTPGRGPAPELVARGLCGRGRPHGPRLARGLSLADLAHAVALVEGGAIGAATAAAAAGGPARARRHPAGRVPVAPRARATPSTRASTSCAGGSGAAAAGWLSAGRPRREAFRVALRLAARDGALDLHEATLDLAEALVGPAERHADDLAADYTYLQPAQPTTIGHLLLAHAYPALRDAERLRRVHGWLDLSVAGAGGSAGSRWPLDRERLAALLGCAGWCCHAKDAMWQADGYVELAAAVATGGDPPVAARPGPGDPGEPGVRPRPAGRRAQPGERPDAAEAQPVRARGGARRRRAPRPASWPAMLVALHTGSARTDHFHVLNGGVPRLLDEALGVTRLAAAVVARARRRAASGWRARPARASPPPPTSPTCWRARRASTTARRTRWWAGRCATWWTPACRPEALTPERLAAAGRAAIGRAWWCPPTRWRRRSTPRRRSPSGLRSGPRRLWRSTPCWRAARRPSAPAGGGRRACASAAAGPSRGCGRRLRPWRRHPRRIAPACLTRAAPARIARTGSGW